MDEDAFRTQVDVEKQHRELNEQSESVRPDMEREVDNELETANEYSFSDKLTICCAKFCFPKPKKDVLKEYERVIVYRLGRLMKEGALGPGTVVIYPKIDEIKARVDTRETPFKSAPLELETADKVAIEVIALCFYRIYQPAKVINITNYDASKFIANKSIALLREAVLGLNLSDILTNKEKIELHMKDDIEKEAIKVGVKVIRVEILNIKVIDPARLTDVTINPVAVAMTQPTVVRPPIVMAPQTSYVNPALITTTQPVFSSSTVVTTSQPVLSSSTVITTTQPVLGSAAVIKF